MKRNLKPITIVHKILENPTLYNCMQTMVGGYELNKKLVRIALRDAKNQGNWVLDLGCGPTPPSYEMFKTSGKKYIGIEFDDKYAKSAEEYIDSSDVILRQSVANSWLLPIKEDKPIIVIAAGLFHHIDDETLQSLSQEFLTKTPKGSSLFAYDPVITNKTSKMGKWLANNDRGKYLRNSDDVRRIFEKNAIVNIKIMENQIRIPVDFMFTSVVNT
jgi:hypothetical protein